MKFFLNLILFASLFILGCASKTVEKVEDETTFNPDVCKDFASNALNTNRCAKFWNDQRLNLRAQELTKKINDWFLNLESNFPTRPLAKLYFHQYNEATDDNVELARDLIERKKAGDRTPDQLMRLGWNIQNFGGEDNRLLPPASYLEIYEKSYVILTEGHNGYEKDPNLILPAVVFKRKVKKDEYEFLLSRPGIDPLPKKEEGWQLTMEALTQLSDYDFMMNMGEGKFPFDWSANRHDPNHIVDYIENPEFPQAIRQYFLSKRALLASATPEEKIVTRLNDMDMLTNEFNYKVRSQSVDVLDTVFGKNSGFLSRDALIKKYQDQDIPDLTSALTRFDQMFYQLHDIYGGAARDGTIEYDTKEIEKILSAKIRNETVKADKLFKYILDDVLGELLEAKALALVLTIPAENQKMLKSVNRGTKRFTADQLSDLSQKQLAVLLSRIEYRTRLGQEIPLTPSKMVADLAQLFTAQDFEAYKLTATYRFYSQEAIPGSLQRKVFVDIAE